MLFVTTKVDSEGFMLRQISSEKNKHRSISLICGILKNKTTKKPPKLVGIENRLAVGGGSTRCVKRHKLPVIQLVSPRGAVCSAATRVNDNVLTI